MMRPVETSVPAFVSSEVLFGLAPPARLPVDVQHCHRNDELDRSDDRSEQDKPCRALFGESAQELQCGRWNSQDASQEHDEDQPEGPLPSSDDAYRKKGEK